MPTLIWQCLIPLDEKIYGGGEREFFASWSIAIDGDGCRVQPRRNPGCQIAKKDYPPKRVTLVLFCFILVGRAGFEPATNGLKARFFVICRRFNITGNYKNSQ